MTKLITTVLLFALYPLSLIAQDDKAAAWGNDKRWALRTGVGHFWCPPAPGRGIAIWAEASYMLPSSLDVYVKMHHSKSNMKLDVERYWPSELGYTRQGERKADVFYNVELGIARSFKLGRHWITPGVGVAWVHSVTWLPSHEEILGVTIVDGQYVPVAVITDYPFYRGDNLLGFCGQVDYTFHFRSGFFIGLRGHMWYTSWVEGITLSPVIGVRF